MTYTATVWLEYGMTTQNKVDGLNNLETISSSANDYIDTILHGERYYTKSEMAAKYFTSATDGTGTGLICETLDGYTAQQIIDAGTPPGCIGVWSGTAASIPAGWYLCDGSNSTPNLTDRFVIGAGGSYNSGDLGGSNVVTPTGTITIAGHALIAAEIPAHTHGYYDYWRSSNTGLDSTSGGPYATGDHAASTDSVASATHNHTSGSSFSGSALDVRGPFMALCYIMKG
jgi:hypothetical protein